MLQHPFGGSAAFLIAPFLPVITFAIGAEASFSYSINQASKEILYVPLDETEELAQFYDYEVLPATYLIDRQGVIRQEHQGAWSEQRLRAAIERELEL